jgi:hypothetical protein
MAEIHGRLGPLPACHVINEQGPSPIRACSHPHQPGTSCLGAAHGRRTANCRPVAAGLADIPQARPTAGSVRSR